jgi:tRNA/tmRNA/rRNA uracil-C5-methylase (TrmA/RlmC/RlmD family)
MTRFQFKTDTSASKQKRREKRDVEREEKQDAYKDATRGDRRAAPVQGKRYEGKNKRGAPVLTGRRARGQTPVEGGRDPRDKRGVLRDAAAEAAPVKDAFSTLIRQTAGETGLFDKLDPEPAPLALLDYDTELELKTSSIRKWWTQHALPDKPTRVIGSPESRHYRSTTKRRLVFRNGGWKWDFFLERLGGEAKGGIDLLEPATHEAVYKQALAKLNEDSYRPLANALNFLIVRGYPNLMVVFNVFRLNADVVRKAGLLAEHLGKMEGGKVVAAHIFYDKSRSDYYLEARVSEGAFRVKKLFGPEFLPMQIDNRRYLLHPTGFFQVNPSILPRVMAEVQNALKPQKTDRLIDLYCGCGLFTLPAAEICAQSIGIEGSPVSIDAAQRAVGSAGPALTRRTRFIASRIDVKTLAKLLPPVDGTPEILLLDPPRQGTAPGVIPFLAERKPRRVAYLFCDMNTMPAEITRWRKQGYMVAKAVPFDMFPGTNNLEMLVVLLPDKYGILNRKKPKVDPVDEAEAEINARMARHEAHVKPRAAKEEDRARTPERSARTTAAQARATGGYRQKTGLRPKEASQSTESPRTRSARPKQDWEKWETGSDKARKKKFSKPGSSKTSHTSGEKRGPAKFGDDKDFRKGSKNAQMKSGARPPKKPKEW